MDVRLTVPLECLRLRVQRGMNGITPFLKVVLHSLSAMFYLRRRGSPARDEFEG